MENQPKTTTEQLQAAKAAAADKLDTFKTEAGEHLATAAHKLDELKDQLLAKAGELATDLDLESLKASATTHFETAKAATAEKLADLQTQAETTYATASAKADELLESADDKFDDLKAEAAVQFDLAQKKVDELKAEAALQIEVAKEKAQGLWDQLFGK